MWYVNYLASVMLSELIRIMKEIPNTARKLVNYPLNPKNGDNFVTPLKRQYLTTGASFVVTILYHLAVGLYTLLTQYLLGALAHIYHIGKNIIFDLWRANPSYSRWAARGVATMVVLTGSAAIVVTMTAWKTGVAVAMTLFNALR